MRQFPSFAEYKGRYNVAESQWYPGEVVHNSESDVPRLDLDEFWEVCQALVGAAEKYAPCNNTLPDGPSPKDFYYVYPDNWNEERTQLFCMNGTCALDEPLLHDLQQVLRQYPLWRIQVMRDPDPGFFVAMIYPEVVWYE